MEKKPLKSRRMIAGSLVALVVGATLGVSVERAYATIGTVGWNYGGQNCGCFNNNCNDEPCCRRCCRRAGNGIDIANCRKFCGQDQFPCMQGCWPGDLEPCEE